MVLFECEHTITWDRVIHKLSIETGRCDVVGTWRSENSSPSRWSVPNLKPHRNLMSEVSCKVQCLGRQVSGWLRRQDQEIRSREPRVISKKFSPQNWSSRSSGWVGSLWYFISNNMIRDWRSKETLIHTYPSIRNSRIVLEDRHTW